MKFSRGRLSVFALQLLLLFTLLAPHLGFAQTFRGSIAGIVTDPTGAAVPGAKIELVDTATGSIHDTTSSGSGEFSFPDLPLGSYTVTSVAPGFGTVKVDRVPVSAGVVYNLPVTMTIAQTAETVEVSAAGLSLDTTSTTQTTLLPSTTVQNTPMNGRDFTQLIAITPGFGGYSAGGFGSVNGTRGNQVNWQIDGSDNNDLWHNVPAVNQGGVEGIAGVTLPLDSIEQFSQQTQSGPETGRNPGGTVNVVTKSGTNAIHGSVYYYNRNEALSKLSPFTTPTNGQLVKNELRNQQYGVSVGGPILKDRLFYFANYEKQQFIIESPASATEPSAAYQAQANAVLAQYGVAVNPVQQTVLNTLWPAYALTGAATADNYSNAAPFNGYSYNGVAKMDFTINSKNTLSGRAYGGQGNQTAPVGTQLPYYFETAPIHVFNYSATLNTVLTPHLTNQVLIGVNYFNQLFYDQNHTFDMAALGLNTGVDTTKLSGAPSITISGFDDLSHATPPSGRNDITGLITDTVAYSVGKHEFRFGGEYRQGQVDEFYHRHERGLFQYDGTQGPWSQTATGNANCDALGNTGVGIVDERANRASAKAAITPAYTDTATLALADYLAGCAVKDGITIGDTARQVFVNTYDLFFQDAWQLSSRLNLNYGLRYDYLGPMHNGYKNLSVFRPSASGTTVPGIAFQGAQIDSLFAAAHNNVSPRVGFSYSPHNTVGVVVRGGFGVFFDEPNLNPFLDNRPPNGGASGAESNPAGPSPVATLSYNDVVIPSDGSLLFPTSSTFAPYGITNGVVNTSGPLVNSYNLFTVKPDFRSAYNYNFNLNVEKSLGPNLLATIGYVGSEGRKLLVIEDINQAAPGTTSLGTFAQNATRPYGAAFPYYGIINEINSAGTSNYSSLQTTLRSTNWHGLTSQFGYTWAHGLDQMTQYRGVTPQNSFDLKAEYGNMDYDTRHNFTTYLNYALPGDAFSGPHWLTHGWQLNSLITLHSGQPYSIETGTDSSGTGEYEDRVNQTGPFEKGSRTITDHSGSLTWFTNNSAFAAPVNTFGTMRRNQLTSPGYEDVDFSVFKDGHITEKVSAQFRVEMFNLFNRTNLAPPDNYLSDAGFGTITTTIGNYNGAPGLGPGEPFNTQLALKIIF